MPNPAELEKLTGIAAKFCAFVAERHPFALADAVDAFSRITWPHEPRTAEEFDAIRPALHLELARRLQQRPIPSGLPDPTPRTTVEQRMGQAYEQLLDDCDGFLRRAAIEASLTSDERIEILRGMLLTRATDNRLKTFFTSGEIKYGAASFQIGRAHV